MTTYTQIRKRVRQLGGGEVESCHIAHVKADHGLTRGPAPNRVSPTQRSNPCPPTKRPYIERALRDLGLLEKTDA